MHTTLLETYIKANLLVAGAYSTLRTRAEARRQDDQGLATLEWVALSIVAVTIAAGALVAIRAVVNRKISQIP